MKLDQSLLSGYNWKGVEEKVYKQWEDSGYFNPDNLKNILKDENGKDKSFTCILPPPNVTGTLHTGHTLMLAIEDVVVRYKRMQGFKTLWLPGTDHAAIATQSVVEKKILKEEGKNRHDIGREEMMKRINTFAMESQATIISQFKSFGASLDWSRLAFTLDEKRNLSVNTMFKKMYDDGLIYRGNRIVNWDPKGQTTISDDEIVMMERDTKLYTFKYSKDFPIAISSTRPETKIGDTAVAVHPDDERYKKYIGQTFECIFAGCKINIKIVADMHVEKDFGTGALGVTPCHSQIDWEIAEKNNLEKKQIINEYAKIFNVENKELLGLKVEAAREYVVNWLKENDLMISEENIKQNVPTAERTGGIVEPLPKLQWFVNVNKKFDHYGKEKSLKDLMIEAVKNDGIKIMPDRFEKVYFHWIENLRDWCISRQIWYGHRVPVWYEKNKDPSQPSPREGETQKIVVGTVPADLENYFQDEDTLDTWFSSGMWTFSTLGWPNQTKDIKDFHPTDFMETGYDILFFWIARMILMSKYALNQIPFKNVYLHGLVRDAQGRKMSKSLGNVLDPRDLIEKYGTDALRMSLLVGNGAGNDLKLSEDKIKAYKNFANKIWNATRFVIEKVNLTPPENLLDISNLSLNDKAVLESWKEKQKDITDEIEKYNLHIASEKIYDYFWKEFCDKIIEDMKDRIIKYENSVNENEIKEKHSAQTLLSIMLREQIITLHPFMPYVSEEIWKFIKKSDDDLLLVTKWIQ